MDTWIHAIDTPIRWGSLLPRGFRPPCRTEVHEFLGYKESDTPFDKPAAAGLHLKDGMRRAIIDAGILPREGQWERFKGRYYSNGPVTIIQKASLSLKTLPVERWSELIEVLQSAGLRVQVCEGGSLSEFEYCLRRSSLVIGPDTGLLHLADHMDIPVLGLYGFSRPERSGPVGTRSEVLHSRTGLGDLPISEIAEKAYKMLGG